MKEKIGFIGQGWIGKNYADDYERRGYETVRYALEEPYAQNKDKLAECEIVLIAVPTPTTRDGFNCDPVIESLKILSPGTVAVIKSTILPGTTKHLQTIFPQLFVMHSPEFLVKATAKFNVENPERNIIGIPVTSKKYLSLAEKVLASSPQAPYEKIMDSNDAELVKYGGNTFLTVKVLFMNILYDFVAKNGGDWETVKNAMVKDVRIGESHMQPVFEGGRGAGGMCFIKDFEAFRQAYKQTVDDPQGQTVIDALTQLNINLLTSTNKSLDLLTDIYELKLNK